MIVPKEDIDAIGSDNSIAKDKYFSYNFWQGGYKAADYQKKLSDILSLGKSWSSDIILFGREDSNNVEIVNEEGVIVEMSFRFDFGLNDTNVLEKVIEFCIYNGLALIAEDFSIMPLNLEGIMFRIKSSYQFRRFLELQGG
ncbi:MAG: hypothetical protein ACTHLE_12475 [Agriterribacter sp.]